VTPILLMAYNRADKFGRLLDRLRSVNAQNIIVCVDGPKTHVPGDADRVAAVRALAEGIDWTKNVELTFRPANLGLRANVSLSVTEATEKHGRVIVIEDDTVPGPNMIPFLESMLDRFADEKRIEHVSGYHLVPPQFSGVQGIGPRLSRYPESYAWATWQRAWAGYDDDLTWAMNASVADIQRIVGSRIGALRWKQNFADAHAGRISTWAYRWLASMWSRDAWVLSPGVNLSQYAGHDDGTHTVLTPKWTELPVYDGSLDAIVAGDPQPDLEADKWISKMVFEENLFGLSRGVAISAVLEARKRARARRANRSQ
jgi:hypothetical protein